VQTEDFLLNYSCERQVIKEVSEIFPHIRVSIFPQALVVETINLRDLSRFVVATQDRDSVLVAHL